MNHELMLGAWYTLSPYSNTLYELAYLSLTHKNQGPERLGNLSQTANIYNQGHLTPKPEYGRTLAFFKLAWL